MLRSLKIRGRLILGFGVMVALILGVVGEGVLSGNRTAFSVTEAGRTATIVVGLKDAILSVRQGRVLTWEYVATGNESVLKGRDEAFALFEKQYVGALSHAVNPTGRELANDYYQADFIAQSNAMIALKAKGAVTDSPEFTTTITAFNAAAKTYAVTNSKAAAFFDDESAKATEAAHEQVAFSKRASIGTGLIAALIAIVAALVISR